MLNQENITRLRMERQHFLAKATPAEYDGLFRLMSPVTTLYWTRPGDPPLLAHRAAFDDVRYNDDKRARREIIKGRFQKGGIGYIDPAELELFAGLYRSDLGKLSKQEYDLLDLLEHEGCMNIHEIKEVTGMFTKDITPILHRLQEGFRVYEDQRDREWDRSWYSFGNEFPEVDIRRYTVDEALKIVLLRFAEAHVFFDPQMAKSFYKLGTKEIGLALGELVSEGNLSEAVIEGRKGYLRTEDTAYLETHDLPEMEPSVILLHRSDFLVKSHETELKKRFTDDDHDVLFYFLIDGEFQGAVFGRFTFGPIELRVLKLALPEAQIASRKNEILKALYGDIDRGESPLSRIEKI